jgi:tetratricopeptide (TPR) repeat protein
MFSVFTLIRAFGKRSEIESLARFLEDTSQVENFFEVKVYATSRFDLNICPDKSCQLDQDAPNLEDEFFSLNSWEDFIGNSDSEIASDLYAMSDSVQIMIEFKDAFPSLVAAVIDKHKHLSFRIQISVLDPLPSTALNEFRHLLNSSSDCSQRFGQERARATIVASNGIFNERIEIANRMSYEGSFDGIVLTRNDCSINGVSTVKDSTVPIKGGPAGSPIDRLGPPLYFFYSDAEYSYVSTDWSPISSLPALDYSPWISLESCLGVLEESAYCPYAQSHTYNVYTLKELALADSITSNAVNNFAEECSLQYKDEVTKHFPIVEWGDAIVKSIYHDSFSDCMPLLLGLSDAITDGQFVMENILCSNEAHLLDLRIDSGGLYIRFSLGSEGYDAHDFASNLLQFGALEEAEAIFRELLKTRLRDLDFSDSTIGQTLADLAKTLEELGHLEEALVIAYQALDHHREHQGTDDLWTNRERLVVARVLGKLGRSSEALSILKDLQQSMSNIEKHEDLETSLWDEAEKLRIDIES